eukprot:6176579-Pleurochrysis_carterae.AAC.1
MSNAFHAVKGRMPFEQLGPFSIPKTIVFEVAVPHPCLARDAARWTIFWLLLELHTSGFSRAHPACNLPIAP